MELTYVQAVLNTGAVALEGVLEGADSSNDGSNDGDGGETHCEECDPGICGMDDVI